MTIVYQGAAVETAAADLAGLLAERAVDAGSAVVECAGEVYGPDSDKSSVALVEGVEVNVFRVVAGG